MEGGCYHSGQLFTAVRSEIPPAQVRSTELFKADELAIVEIKIKCHCVVTACTCLGRGI